jgi:hypothetical protein
MKWIPGLVLALEGSDDDVVPLDSLGLHPETSDAGI